MQLLIIAVSAVFVVAVSAVNISHRISGESSPPIATPTSDSAVRVDPPPTLTPSPAPTTPPVNESTGSFVYPDSESISENMYRSFDDSDVITDWYKNRIQEEGFTVRTAVSTKTNGEVLNKLEASDGERYVEIEITKEPESSETVITVVEG